MVQKKALRVSNNLFTISRDIIINQILKDNGLTKGSSALTFGLTIYNIATLKPLEVAVGILAVKLGFSNKVILALIVAFLL